MKPKFVAVGLIALSMLTACQQSKEENKKNEPTEELVATSFVLVGKKAKLVYPDFEAEMEYLSEDQLHWKTVSETGEISEGVEKASYKQLNASQFFVSWIEQDGISVSQIIDMKEGKVFVFLTYADENSPRGKRAAQFIEGTWKAL